MVNSQVNGFEEDSWVFHLPEGISTRTNEINAPQGEFTALLNFDFSRRIYNYVGSEYKQSNSPESLPLGLPENASEVYFNIYVYGINKPDVSLSIQFIEDDNQNTKYDPGQEDGVVMSIPLGHSGWKLFSARYDQISFSTFAPRGGNGNKIHEPEKVIVVNYGLESQSNISGSTYKDFPIFTIGAPFNPEDY